MYYGTFYAPDCSISAVLTIRKLYVFTHHNLYSRGRQTPAFRPDTAFQSGLMYRLPSLVRGASRAFKSSLTRFGSVGSASSLISALTLTNLT